MASKFTSESGVQDWDFLRLSRIYQIFFGILFVLRSNEPKREHAFRQFQVGPRSDHVENAGLVWQTPVPPPFGRPLALPGVLLGGPRVVLRSSVGFLGLADPTPTFFALWPGVELPVSSGRGS